MPKKSKSSRRASSRNKRAHRRRTHRRRGGADALEGAPVKYSLAGSWPSRMSLGQGQDYFKYHVGQHGGSGYSYNHSGAPLDAIGDSRLSDGLRSHAMLDGLDGAFKDISGLKDQAGGRRRHTRRKGKKHGKKHGGKRGKKHGKSRGKSRGKSHRKSHRSRRTRRKRGGDLGYSPFPGKGMLLDSSTAYAQAGLNPQWKTDVAFDLAKVRDTQ